ncbi:hypothetical protein AVEN_152179-1 [Araneus ventricosus]|uniref:Uncharacterized protein n=1 Tax=Araneus ventricosus TaxID=182803 RepID=A0A4Y2HKT5_ARAVE|nr:hypothetical protein AVEN_152179-1 [Araneus ventricosus]
MGCHARPYHRDPVYLPYVWRSLAKNGSCAIKPQSTNQPASHARPTRGGMLLSMRSRKQTEWQQLLMESSLAYPRGKEGKNKNSRRGKTRKETRH